MQNNIQIALIEGDIARDLNLRITDLTDPLAPVNNVTIDYASESVANKAKIDDFITYLESKL